MLIALPKLFECFEKKNASNKILIQLETREVQNVLIFSVSGGVRS
jgi:hypothetical protein